MDPEKEAKYLLQRLITMWGFYVSGWTFSATWIPGFNGWMLKAETSDLHGRPVRVLATVGREEWEEWHDSAVDDKAEQMYHDAFREECVVGEDGKTPEERILEMRNG